MRTTLTITTLMAVAALAMAGWVWGDLPEPMPIHWGPDGQADGWGSRAFGALLMPGIMLGLPPALYGLTRLDPRPEHVARIQRPLGHVIVGMQAFLLMIQGMVLRASLTPGHAIDEGLLIAGMGVLFAITGNALGKTRSNWFFGIRTPWTLQSDAVWHRTHRFGGWLFALTGIASILLAFTTTGPVRMFLPIVLVLSATVASVVYSWMAWRQEQARGAVT